MRLLADTDPARGRCCRFPVPHSLQALIAARLDTLPADGKSLLQDAAVVGNVFWPTALAAIGSRDGDHVELGLRELARKELIRPSDDRSMEGEPAYAFWHILVRDVAYAQISRAGRAQRHRAAAEWIEQRAGARVEDVAEVIAYHYLAALDLARAAGLEERVEELEEGAIRYLPLGAARALPLDVASAEARLAKALELASADHPARAMLLERWAEAAEQQGHLHEAKSALQEAIDLYREQGDAVARGRALTVLSHLLQRLGDPRREDVMAEALNVLDGEPPAQSVSPPTRNWQAAGTSVAPIASRSRRPTRRSRSPASSGSTRRPVRSASGVALVRALVTATDWWTCAERSSSRSSRARAATPL